MSDNDGAVWVAEDDLCAHIDEFVDEEEAAFKHFLMEEHGAACLCGHDEEYAEEVGGESWPGGVGHCHEGSVDETVDLIVVVARNVDVVAFHFEVDAQAGEGIGDDAQVADGGVFDGESVARHGGHADEAAHFNHVGENGVCGASEFFHAFDGEEVGGDAADFRSHAVEHFAELLYVGLAGGVVDGGCSVCQHGGHDDVGRSRDGGFVEEHVAAFEPTFREDVEGAGCFVVFEFCTQFLEPVEMRVEAAATDFVAAWAGDDGVAKAGNEGAKEEHTAAQARAALEKFLALEIVDVDVFGAEGDVAFLVAHGFHVHVFKETDEVVDIEDVGYVGNAHFFAGEDGGADDLQRFVFGTLRFDFAADAMAAFYYK